MKKALALVLALVLALSMAVSAFAVDLVVLDKQTVAEAGRKLIEVIDVDYFDFYFYEGGKYYVALDDQPWENVKLTANGNVSAKLVEFDPEKMIIAEDVVVDADGNVVSYKDIVKYAIYRKGDLVESDYNYDYANARCAELNKQEEVTYYTVARTTNVNVIEITVADNYSAAYTEGTLKIEAELSGVKYAGVIETIVDVVIFEYEEVKWTANNFAKGATLTRGQGGYSDYITAMLGYGAEYDEDVLRDLLGAEVVSTTEFRAIEGKNLKVVCFDGISVTLKEIAAGQKGVNFRAEIVVEENEAGNLETVSFGFLGNQVVKGEFEIDVDLPITYYDLREAFGIKVEEDDIITYYVYNQNNEVVTKITVDYMTYDPKANVEFTIKGENETLGYYTLGLEVPAAEAGEANPNTGAESVVGVVAALAVVSVATAAAVSLKK